MLISYVLLLFFSLLIKNHPILSVVQKFFNLKIRNKNNKYEKLSQILWGLFFLNFKPA